MKATPKQYAALIMNLAAAVFSGIGNGIAVCKYGAGMFTLYTVDSNLFAMIACGLYAFFLARQIVRKRDVPVFAVMLKYMAVCCLSVTFCVVVAVLAPMNGIRGYQMMLLSDDMLFHHLLAPVTAALSFFLFDRVPYKPSQSALLALLPTGIYAAVSILLNLAGVMDGPYPFLKVYQQPVFISILWCFLILGGAYLLAWLIARSRCLPSPAAPS